MNGSGLSKVSHEKEFWPTISNDLKPSKHFSNVFKTADKLVGFIGRTFEYKSENCIYSIHVYALI